jgi:glycosyltransferase involved in cell wall biosynthesis
MSDLLYLIMPRGSTHGWGVCGKYLALELSKKNRLRYVCEKFSPEDIGDENQYKALATSWTPKESLESSNRKGDGTIQLDAPAIQAVQGQDLRPITFQAHAPVLVGYTFFETPFLDPEDVTRANAYYDVVAAGSSWCQRVLERGGVRNTQVVIQGVDISVFHPFQGNRAHFKDQFVVFSGGKLELRKGQDLALRAFKVLQDRHDDVLFVTSWYNYWDGSLMTMQASPYIRFEKPNGNYQEFINRLVSINGIDPDKVVVLPPMSQNEMANVIANTDCGVFPNRCEGGTNLVLMEYMACGKPAVASYSSGHKDVLTLNNSIPLTDMKPFDFFNTGHELVNRWDDPDLEEIIEKLEWAYHNRDELHMIGQNAAASMKDMTWHRAANRFMDIIGSGVQ